MTEAALGMPKVRVHFQASDWIRVYAEYVDVCVLDPETAGPAGVEATSVSRGIQIEWTAGDDPHTRYSFYRSVDRRR